MNATEMGELLAFAALSDNRKVGDADILAWLRMIGDLPFEDSMEAVARHYGESTERLMPAHVRIRVRAMRKDRIDREVTPAPSHEIADQPGRYAGALRDALRRIGDGLSIRRAIGPAPVREGPPPEEFTEARAALDGPLTRQEIAALQAGESRKAREAADRKEADGDA